MACINQVDLLLIGKTRNGKSATGNSILKRKAFKSRSSATSVTLKTDYEVSDFNGRIIKVVDGPGVGDTRMDNDKAVEMMVKEMSYAICTNPRGYHAFILVVRFGGRFTEEDRLTIEFLKAVFGQDFVKDFCILLLSCGDSFEHESEETGKSFPQWCKKQTGELLNLIKECDNRVVLFDNVTRDEVKRNKQIENLLHVVDSLNSRGRRYTDANFAGAKAARDLIMVESKKPLIRDETMMETSLILAKIHEVQDNNDLGKKIELFEQLKVRVKSLLKSLSSKDQGTGVLHDLSEQVKLIGSTITKEIALCKSIIEERENVSRQENANKTAKAELEEKYTQELRKMKLMYGEIEKNYRQIRSNNENNTTGSIVKDVIVALSALVPVLAACIIS